MDKEVHVSFNKEARWSDFKRGDKKAFESIFIQYHQDLFQYGIKIVKDREQVDDCIQQLFLELWESRERLAEVVSEKGYLLRALKYKLIRNIKKNANNIPISGDSQEPIEFSYETLLIAQQDDIELKKKLLSTIQRLTGRQQEAVYLRFYSQMSYEEIGKIMSISYQSVVNLISHSIKFLRENMFPLLAAILIESIHHP